jgi:hypothetical protein
MILPASSTIPPARRVILISTSLDLVVHRERVREALARVDGIAPLPAEPGPAASGDADLITRAAVRGAGICVLLVAWRYGHVPPGELRSITHDAYLEARAAGLPILVFLADPATDATAGPGAPFPAVTRDPSHRAQLLAFRAELEFAHAVHYFISPRDLAASVTGATTALIADLHAEQRRAPTLIYPRGPRTPRDQPPRAPGFAGRERERTALIDALRRGQSVSLSAVVAGTAGVGASSLAAEALHALAGEPDAFPGGIAWVRCDARSDLDGLAWIYDRVLAAWGVTLAPGDPTNDTAAGALPAGAAVELRERALRQLRSSPPLVAGGQEDRQHGAQMLRPALLLLDNVERRLPLDRALEALAPLAITVLVTMRHRPASPHLRLLPLDMLDTSAAIRLFASRYRDRGGPWETDADTVGARFVVELLSRLPLAIELAAARAASFRLSVHALGDELAAADRQGRLTGPSDAAPAVRYLLDQTLAALPGARRARFAALALPDGPDWPLPVVERFLAGIPLNAPGAASARTDLEALAALSLITISTSHSHVAHSSGAVALPRVYLHPLLRDRALAEWERQPDDIRHAAATALLDALDSFVVTHRTDPSTLAREEELMRGALRSAARYMDADSLAAIAARWSDHSRASASATSAAPDVRITLPVAAIPAAIPAGESGKTGGADDDISAIATARLDSPAGEATAPDTLPIVAPSPPAPPGPIPDQVATPTRRGRRWWPFGRGA